MNRKLFTCASVLITSLFLPLKLHAQGVSITKNKKTVEAVTVSTTAVTNADKAVRVQTNAVTVTKTNEALVRLENNIVRLNAGAILLNPYKLGEVRTNAAGSPVRDLSDGDAQAKFFLDIGANWVWAWNVDRRARWVGDQNSSHERGRGFQESVFSKPSMMLEPDFQGHLSFVAKDDKETTTSAIIGSGEFGLEVTLGIPLYRAVYTDKDISANYTRLEADEIYDTTLHAHWVGLVLASGGTTDAAAFDIHRRDFFGGGYRAAFKQFWDKSDETAREVVLSFQVGYARVDSVAFANRDTDHSVRLRNGDVPDYHSHGALAFEGEVYVPVSGSLNVVFGARLYSGIDPNPWNAYVAATFPLSKLGKLFE